jgi:hypothetical protein
MLEKLEEWFGVTIDEYPSMGHELEYFLFPAKAANF